MIRANHIKTFLLAGAFACGFGSNKALADVSVITQFKEAAINTYTYSIAQPALSDTTGKLTEVELLSNNEVVIVGVDSTNIADTLNNKLTKREIRRLTKLNSRFIPSPKRALWLALVLPGGGQIYNRKYWKLPIIYGGFVGCTYAFLWNQRMYLDYSQAYIDIMDDDASTNSYINMISPNYDVEANLTTLQTSLKRKKDYYRRYRDMSAFIFIGIYILSVVDAYVDAELSVFDISRDLSLSVQPAVITNNSVSSTGRETAYGLGCSLHF